MTFAAPLLLLALLPWTALVAYLLIGRRKRVLVPFVELWKMPIRPRRTTRALHVPPAAVTLMLLALLAALLAAARPALKVAQHEQRAQEDPAATRPVGNIGITHVALRERPVTQLQLRLRNDSPQSSVRVRLTSDSSVLLEAPLGLHPSGTKDHFIDLSAQPGRSVTVELLTDDEAEWDDRAVLSRRSPWPRLEPRAAMPQEVQKLVEAYSRQRPPTDESQVVLLLNSAADLPTAPAVMIASRSSATAAGGEAAVSPHPVTRGIERLSALSGDAVVAPPPAHLASWTTLVSVGGRPALLARESPARQVYVGIHSQSLASAPEFVYLWTNIFDWVGGSAAQTWVAHPTAAPQQRPAPSPGRGVPPEPRRLEGPLTLVALSLALLSALTWPRRPADNQAPVQAA
jgi:hypothetical protein